MPCSRPILNLFQQKSKFCSVYSKCLGKQWLRWGWEEIMGAGIGFSAALSCSRSITGVRKRATVARRENYTYQQGLLPFTASGREVSLKPSLGIAVVTCFLVSPRFFDFTWVETSYFPPVCNANQPFYTPNPYLCVGFEPTEEGGV